MPVDQWRRHVGLARVQPARQGSLLASSAHDELKCALNPSSKVERYRRVWRLSRLEDCDGFLCGKMGFSKSRLTEETFYDEKSSDFVTMERDSREGAVSCFVLYFPPSKPSEALLAFEEQPPDIRRQSFIGAFSRFLVDSRSPFEVDTIRRDIEFVPWLDEMERVTEFSGTFRQANPTWRPRTEQVREIVEQTRAESMKVVAKTTRDGGLDVAESILGGIVEHSRAGYGDWVARGVRGGSEFNYRRGSSEIIEEIVERAGDTAQEVFHKLMEVVRRKLDDLL